MLQLIHYGIVAVVLALAIYYLYLMYTSYKEIAAQPGEWIGWEQLWAIGRNSATKTLARVTGFVSTAIYSLASLAGFAGLPEVQAWINAHVDANTSLFIFAGLAILTELARNRSL